VEKKRAKHCGFLAKSLEQAIFCFVTSQIFKEERDCYRAATTACFKPR